MLCFYHRADLDGICSGAIVKHAFPDCTLVGIDYGEPFPWEIVGAGESVFMVDFSLPMEDMIRLNDLANLCWIDHHKTAIAEADAVGFQASEGQVLVVGLAACELTWDFVCRDNTYIDSVPLPKAVHFLGRYDVWDWQDKPGALAFQYGMRLRDTNPNDTDFWRMVFSNSEFVEQVICEGELVLRYEKQTGDRYAQDYVLDVDFDGLRFVALNRGNANSKAVDAVYDTEKHDAMMLFCRGELGWKVSLFSDKENIDVSAIAKKYGGGGHAGAAGFLCKDLPFLFPGL